MKMCMKYKILFFVVFFFLRIAIAFSQFVIEVEIKDCRSDNYLQQLSTFKLYKDDDLIGEFDITYLNTKSVEVTKKGNYKIEYTTYFGKAENVYLTISKRKTYKVVLCLAYIDYDSTGYIPFVNQLKNEEEYTIKCVFRNNFLESEKTLVVRKREDKYFVSLGEREIELSPEQVESLRHFEIELNYISVPDKTNIDTYILSYNNRLLKIDDGTWWWNGGLCLLKNLGWE